MKYALENTTDPSSNFCKEDCSLPITHSISLITTNAIVRLRLYQVFYLKPFLIRTKEYTQNTHEVSQNTHKVPLVHFFLHISAS